MDQQKTTKVPHGLAMHMALRIISNHVPTIFLVSQKSNYNTASCLMCWHFVPYSCVESDANKKDLEVI